MKPALPLGFLGALAAFSPRTFLFAILILIVLALITWGLGLAFVSRSGAQRKDLIKMVATLRSRQQRR